MHNLVELWSLLALFFSKIFDQTKSRLVNDLQMWGYSTLKVFERLGLKDWCLVPPPPPPPISLHSVETLGFATSHLRFVQDVCPAKPAPHGYKRNTILLFGGRAQDVSENHGGHPGLPVPNSMYSLCGHKAPLNLCLVCELRSCMEVEVAVLGSPSLTSFMVFVAPWKKKEVFGIPTPNRPYHFCGHKAPRKN